MYKIDKLNELAKIVAEKREANAALEPRRMTAEEKDTLLATFHPDYKQDEFTVLSAGVNTGDKVPTQL
ncbi:MAG TPA: succinate dehydrogenase/fumarate reductase flavoprotein subunit, partial [Ruminococcus sp.]|nr:succinate dehydrogenase/fumarate reductase flavoprotein subunit [Ruminococcus sp.]